MDNVIHLCQQHYITNKTSFIGLLCLIKPTYKINFKHFFKQYLIQAIRFNHQNYLVTTLNILELISFTVKTVLTEPQIKRNLA